MENRSPLAYRKRIRIPTAAYLEPGSAWLVTIRVEDRRPAFADPMLAGEVAALLEERCAALETPRTAYCLMPDHAHLLLQIVQVGLVDIVRDVKSRSTRLWWRYGGMGTLWQRSFHDHGLRTMADFDGALTYLLENPVRAGLVEDWADYPLSGGLLVRPGPRPS